MGRIHNELRRGEIPRGVRDALGAGDTEAALERFSETLQPIFDPWLLPEHAYLRGEQLAAHTRVSAAVAAEFSAVVLLNVAANRNLLCVVEAAWASGGVQTYAIGMTTEANIIATFGASTQGVLRDRRVPLPAFIAVCTTLTGSDPAALGQQLETAASAAATERVRFDSMPVIMPPGHGLVIQGQTALTQVIGGFRWRERRAFPGELV